METSIRILLEAKRNVTNVQDFETYVKKFTDTDFKTHTDSKKTQTVHSIHDFTFVNTPETLQS